MPNSIKGFQTKDGVKKYDYNALDNLPNNDVDGFFDKDIQLNIDSRTQTNNPSAYYNEEHYLNPADHSTANITGNACTVSDITSTSITVTEGGTGSKGVAFPLNIENKYGSTHVFKWDATGTSNTRLWLLAYVTGAWRYINLDNTGERSSAEIVISQDGKTITVGDQSVTSSGSAFSYVAFLFSAATGTTVSYTGISLTYQGTLTQDLTSLINVKVQPLDDELDSVEDELNELRKSLGSDLGLNLNRPAASSGWFTEAHYLNPTKYQSLNLTTPLCAVSDITKTSITVTENGSGGTGVSYPFDISPYYGETIVFRWNSGGDTNTRLRLQCYGNNVFNHTPIDITGTKESCEITISSDGKTISVDGTAVTGTNPFLYVSFFFGAATDTTVSYTDVSLRYFPTAIPSKTSDLINDNGFITADDLPEFRPFSGIINTAHRGAKPSEIPENTLPAYAMAAKMGFDYIEIDARLTSDGEIVSLHDETINRTARNADGTAISEEINISDITLEQAKQYVFCDNFYESYPTVEIPTLEEITALARTLGIGIIFDLYLPISTAVLDDIYEILDKYEMRDHVIMGSSTYNTVLACANYYPKAWLSTRSSTYSSIEQMLSGLAAFKNDDNRVFVNVRVESLPTYSPVLRQNGYDVTFVSPTQQEFIENYKYLTCVLTDEWSAKEYLQDYLIAE